MRKTNFMELFVVKIFNVNEVYLSYVCIKTNKVMENQSNSVNHMAMSYGLYMGLVLILNSVIFYVMGSPFSNYSGYISYAIIIGGIALLMRTYRDKNAEVGVTYGRALGLGTLQSLFASLILAFFTFVLFKLVDNTLYFRNLVFYIHANPQLHGIIDDFRFYPWSSYERILKNAPTRLQKDAVLQWFSSTENYIEYHDKIINLDNIKDLMIE